eukprot:CAMPEP_0179164304 /NCGR_PEP_ID=MMETSP0796-20121207/80620_1 /TAXON_ID=73915 /ORGANISM="Pyrodinium bahamense, Strain pbaha01" /LENGTH=48 /DNA_ID= /DNA_START= /DNA_END= /DNA_ORIENTATION=
MPWSTPSIGKSGLHRSAQEVPLPPCARAMPRGRALIDRRHSPRSRLRP